MITAFQTGGSENYAVGQYHAKSLDLLAAKLAQFPTGTRFVLANGSAESEERKQLDDRIKELLLKHGLILQGAGK